MARYSDETIVKALDKIARRKYVLPAIQREFVWGTDKICALFDSIMRAYPINAFLYWQVDKDNADRYRVYDFVLNYHQLNAPGCPPHLGLPPEERIAVLDGQQRLTALNVGLRGSHAERAKYRPRGKPQSYPQKFLYLDICAAPREADDRGEELVYRFDFLTPEDATEQSVDEAVHWFRIADVLAISEDEHGLEIQQRVQELGLAEHPHAYKLVYKLWSAVHVRPHISFYLEEAQDLDRVLEIFVRVNSQGEVLSHSDLLMSIATAQWTSRDAREAIPETVHQINAVGQGFNFTRDNVLKAGLVLIGVADVGFKAKNFSRENMEALEVQWDEISRTLLRAVELLSSFGLSGGSIRANNVLLPVAHYLHYRDVAANYLTSSSDAEDRARVRDWTIRALIRPGVWGSGLDTLLGRLRNAVEAHGSAGFPSGAIESEMAALGKSLRFDEELVESLVDSTYRDSETFPLLAILYGKVIDPRQPFHVDHIFPQALLRRDTLRKVGYGDDDVERIVRECKDGLANLQLLQMPENIAKREALPLDWARCYYSHDGVVDEVALGNYLVVNDMEDLPKNLEGFLDFYDRRRSRLRDRLTAVLGKAPGVESVQAT